MEIGPVGVELFHADRQTDGQTDLMKLVTVFHNYAKVCKITEARGMVAAYMPVRSQKHVGSSYVLCDTSVRHCRSTKQTSYCVTHHSKTIILCLLRKTT
jgi:hypothetical protein